jgi:hypothetical protein
MRQLTVAFLSVIFSVQAFAFHDVTTLSRIEQLKQRLETEAPQNRLAQLEAFKDFMYRRLNTMPMPEDILNTPDDDPRIEEFRSLTEFSGYVNLIAPKAVTGASCRAARNDIVNSANTQGAEATEAVEALKILNSLCK